MGQDVDVVTHIKGRGGMLFLTVFFIIVVFHPNFSLHVGLLYHLNLFTIKHFQNVNGVSVEIICERKNKHAGTCNAMLRAKYYDAKYWSAQCGTLIHIYQFFRPHVIQDPLCILAVVAAFHDGQQQF